MFINTIKDVGYPYNRKYGWYFKNICQSNKWKQKLLKVDNYLQQYWETYCLPLVSMHKIEQQLPVVRNLGMLVPQETVFLGVVSDFLRCPFDTSKVKCALSSQSS